MSARRLALACVATLALLVAGARHAPAFERKPVAIAAFFRPPEVQQVRVSADGAFLTAIVRLGAKREIRVYRRSSMEVDVALKVPSSVDLDVEWVARDRFVIESWRRRGTKWAYEVVVVGGDEGRVIQSRHALAVAGTIVAPLPGSDGHVLFQRARDVYRIDLREIADEKAVAKWIADDRRVTRLPEGASTAVVDRDGDVRAALVLEDDDGEVARRRIVHRARGARAFREVLAWDADEPFFVAPLGFTADGERLLVASNRDRDRFALVELDPATGAEGRVIFEHETAEIVDLAWSYDRASLAGVVYLDNGEPRMHYLDGAYAAERERIAALAPGHTVRVLSTSADLGVVAYAAYSDTDSGGFSLFDAKDGSAREIGRVSTLLDAIDFAPRRRFTVRAAEGPEIEAIFTEPVEPPAPIRAWDEPAAPRTPPLVVLPHGGPLGVRDDLGFDPVAQLLAYYGYAVLQVNYRGSGGRGKAFEAAGFGEVGRGIEDDIDAAYDYVVAQRWVDPDRVAAVGGSYGGYASLMGAIRHPDRYRCVVSFAGVTDLPVLFDEWPARRSERVRNHLVDLVGDPDRDLEDMVQRSPVYRASEISTPVFLVHGSKDVNVDVDHAYRMRLALERAGVPVRFRVLAGLDHSFGSPATADDILEDVLRFLDEHMKPRAARGGAGDADRAGRGEGSAR
ncbi:MAG: alpha/beta fold hydrolase [Myxococcota bacterium]|nr:S9 family peptidase [Myxococcales bacterium]